MDRIPEDPRGLGINFLKLSQSGAEQVAGAGLRRYDHVPSLTDRTPPQVVGFNSEVMSLMDDANLFKEPNGATTGLDLLVAAVKDMPPSVRERWQSLLSTVSKNPRLAQLLAGMLHEVAYNPQDY